MASVDAELHEQASENNSVTGSEQGLEEESSRDELSKIRSQSNSESPAHPATTIPSHLSALPSFGSPLYDNENNYDDSAFPLALSTPNPFMTAISRAFGTVDPQSSFANLSNLAFANSPIRSHIGHSEVFRNLSSDINSDIFSETIAGTELDEQEEQESLEQLNNIRSDPEQDEMRLARLSSETSPTIKSPRSQERLPLFMQSHEEQNTSVKTHGFSPSQSPTPKGSRIAKDHTFLKNLISDKRYAGPISKVIPLETSIVDSDAELPENNSRENLLDSPKIAPDLSPRKLLRDLSRTFTSPPHSADSSPADQQVSESPGRTFASVMKQARSSLPSKLSEQSPTSRASHILRELELLSEEFRLTSEQMKRLELEAMSRDLDLNLDSDSLSTPMTSSISLQEPESSRQKPYSQSPSPSTILSLSNAFKSNPLFWIISSLWIISCFLLLGQFILAFSLTLYHHPEFQTVHYRGPELALGLYAN
ncbi:uncharacterized protein V1516DRAFT_681862 [Lipomyces oligophaga]|uniref:uncharacterized protein n=1 Tax=Lipomyces oligophaga TaxID=45792 RepID=UPI0034CE14B8